jgi:hypothetical protein
MLLGDGSSAGLVALSLIGRGVGSEIGSAELTTTLSGASARHLQAPDARLWPEAAKAATPGRVSVSSQECCNPTRA